MSDQYAKENTDYWAVAFRGYTDNDTFEQKWGIDMLWKIPLLSSKEMFLKALTSDPKDFNESAELTTINTSLQGMALRGRFNPDIIGPFVFMAEEGMWEDEDAFEADFENGDKVEFMKLIRKRGIKVA